MVGPQPIPSFGLSALITEHNFTILAPALPSTVEIPNQVQEASNDPTTLQSAGQRHLPGSQTALPARRGAARTPAGEARGSEAGAKDLAAGRESLAAGQAQPAGTRAGRRRAGGHPDRRVHRE